MAQKTSDADIKAEAEKRVPELAVAFADPKNIELLKNHERTKHFFKDREFAEKMDAIHKNPELIKESMGASPPVPLPVTGAARGMRVRERKRER